MIDKRSLRREFKELRRSMERYDRRRADSAIAESFIACEPYRSYDTLLCYISSEIEVDTFLIINRALADGKKVYAPKCESGNAMRFYRIYSFNDLQKGAYGLLEPDGSTEEYSGEKALCIVPALSYDFQGHRLGFGMGFYDRYLSENDQLYAVGLCYDTCIMDMLPTEAHDIAVKKIITDIKTIDTEV